jgi:predicted DsbA family dithiol-disulfide isomerase
MKVEIWSDVVCPWCYIGKRRFEQALARFAHRDEVEIVWRSFELDPGAPRSTPGSLNDMLAKKMGTTTARAAAMNAHVSELAAGEGLDYHLDIARPGNTFDAHRLIHLAAANGKQGEAKERLMRAYFTEGAAIGERETLVALGVELGLPAEDVRAALESDTYAAEVRADENRARMFGISGVPFFAIDERYGISGAQPAELFTQTLEQAWAEAHPLTMVGVAGTDGADCADGSCAIDPASEG